MSENEKMARFTEMQIRQIRSILEANRHKYDQRRIDIVEAEIEGMTLRVQKLRGEI